MSGRWLIDVAAEWRLPLHRAAERLLPAGAIYFQMDEADVQRISAAVVRPDCDVAATRPGRERGVSRTMIACCNEKLDGAAFGATGPCLPDETSES